MKKEIRSTKSCGSFEGLDLRRASAHQIISGLNRDELIKLAELLGINPADYLRLQCRNKETRKKNEYNPGY